MTCEYADVYDALAAAAEAFELPEAWRWLAVDADCRRVADPQAVWGQLTARFEEDLLLRAGVAQRRDGVLGLAAALREGCGGLIVFRGNDGAAFDVVTDAGCLSGGVPVLAAASERRILAQMDAVHGQHLWVVGSLAETIWLRSLGLAAAPIAALDRLSQTGLETLLEIVKAPPPEAPDSDSLHENACSGRYTDASFDVTLVAHALLAPPGTVVAGLAPTAQHLDSAQRHLGYDFEDVSVWYPTKHERGGLEFCRRLHATEAIREILCRCQAKHRLAEALGGALPQARPATAAETYCQLLNAVSRQPDEPTQSLPSSQELGDCQQQYDAFADRHFVAPLIAGAVEAGRPEDRVLAMAMAHLVRLHHRMMPIVFKMLPRTARSNLDNETGLLPREVLKQFTAVSGQLQKLALQFRATRRKGRGR